MNQRAGGPNKMLLRADPHGRERIHDAQIGYCPRPITAIHSPVVSKALK
jgi:hypothetical protein